MNEELETRTRELNALSSRYAETLQRMPWPVLMVNQAEDIQIWNKAAQLLLDVHPSTMANLRLERLPVDSVLLRSILRCARKSLLTREPALLKDQTFQNSGDREGEKQIFDLHFTPMLQPGHDAEGVLIMFGPAQTSAAPRPRKRSSAGSG